MDLLTFITRNREQKKNFYGTSEAGTGKTAGLLIAIYHDLKRYQNLLNVQYVMLCTAYDMAYATFLAAQNFQRNFHCRFAIGFISKESMDLNRDINDFDLIIGTPNEIFDSIRESRRVTHFICDETDAYMPWQKTINMIEENRNAVVIILSSHRVTEINQILNLTTHEVVRRYYDYDPIFDDSRLYLQIRPFA